MLPPARKGSGVPDVPAVGWLVFLQTVPNQGMMSLAGWFGVQQWWEPGLPCEREPTLFLEYLVEFAGEAIRSFLCGEISDS